MIITLSMWLKLKLEQLKSLQEVWCQELLQIPHELFKSSCITLPCPPCQSQQHDSALSSSLDALLAQLSENALVTLWHPLSSHQQLFPDFPARFQNVACTVQ